MNPADNPALAQPADEVLASWPVLRLMQHIEAHKASLGAEGSAALYERWLSGAGGGAAQAEAYAAHYNLAVLRQEAGRRDLAEAHYLQVLTQRELPEARYNLGLLLEQGGREQEAMAQWRRLLAQPASALPLRAAALHGLIRISRRLGLRGALRRHLQAALALDPSQTGLAQELAALGAAPPGTEFEPLPVAAAQDDGPLPVIHVVAVCFNEAAILPFFLDHYIHFVGARKVVLYDGGSSDATAEIAARYPQVELIVEPSEKLDDRALMRTRNEAWKAYRQDCDWMIVCDVDELLYHPRLHAQLREFKRQGVTLPMVEGFEMLSKTHPVQQPGRYIWQDIQTGDPNPRYYNKNLIFDPVIEINYTMGCHGCEPTGPVKRSEGFVFKNLHFRMLSHQHIVEKSRRAAARLSDWNKQTNAGFHYRRNAEMSRADYNRLFLKAFNVVRPRPRPLLRREAFGYLQQQLLMADAEACIVELGGACGFGGAADSGSTEVFAWHVHGFGGRLLCLEAEARRARHLRQELAARGLLGAGVEIAATVPADLPPIDLLFIGSSDWLGDAADRFEDARALLHDFTALEPRLGAQALIALDGVLDDECFEGRFALLAPYLIGRGYQVRLAGHTTVFGKEQASHE